MRFFLILFVLLFSFPAYALWENQSEDRINIPKQYLEYWKPQSETLDIGVEFNADGTYTYSKNNKSVAHGDYKIIKIDQDHRVYMVTYETDETGRVPPSYSYYVLDIYEQGKLRTYNLYGSNITEEDWEKSLQTLADRWKEITTECNCFDLADNDVWTKYSR